MSDQRRPPQDPDGTAELLAALRELGSDYEPDVTAIERRTRHRPAPKARRLPTAIRNSRPVLLPAAAVLLLIGGVVGVTSVGIQHSQFGQTAANPNWTTTTAPPSPTPSPKVAATPKRTASAASSKPASSPTAPRRTTAGSSAKPDGQTAPVEVAVEPLSQVGMPVDLSRPPLIDWLAVGARADLKQVRAKAAAGTPLLSVEQPPTATSVTGLFSTSWTAGFPEQTHDAAVRWLKADAKPGLTLVLTRSSQARTVLLFAGTQDLQGTVAISGKGLTPSRTALGAVSATPQGIVITLSLPPAKGPTRIQLSGTAAGPMPSVYLAAATLTP